jgi:hypothetical protein
MTPDTPPKKSAGLIGARVTIAGTLKLGCHIALTVKALRAGRSKWWLAAGVASLTADLVMLKKMSNPDYRLGLSHYATEAVDSAVWGMGASELPTSPDAVMIANAMPSGIVAGWRFAAGASAIPVYDEGPAYPYLESSEAIRASVQLAVPIVVPFLSAALSRKVVGKRTHWANLAWGVIGAVIGVSVARQRHSLQEESKLAWLERATVLVEHEQLASRFHLMSASSPGHDFKKTLFALGLAGSAEAMAAALEQGERPGLAYSSLSGRLLREAAHRVPIEPPEQGLRLLTESQVTSLQTFLTSAAEAASDGSEQVLRVEDTPGFGLQLRYLDSKLMLRNDPPPLAARLNPTAVTIGVGAALKICGSVFPYERGFSPLIAFPMAGLDIYGLIRYWRQAPSRENLGEVVRLSLINNGIGILASTTRLAHLTNPYGSNVYPSFYALRDILFVLLPNWDMLSQNQRRSIPLGLAASIGATLFRRRHFGTDYLELWTDFTAGMAMSVFRVSTRVEDEANMLEEVMFAWYSAQIASARRRGEEEEMSVYSSQLAVAIDALHGAIRLTSEDRGVLESDCSLMGDWIRTHRHLSRAHHHEDLQPWDSAQSGMDDALRGF